MADHQMQDKTFAGLKNIHIIKFIRIHAWKMVQGN